MHASCPFCALDPTVIAGANALAVRLNDRFPVAPGHSLIIPRRHIGSFFEATAEERTALLSLLDEAHTEVSGAFRPDGFTIGINDGAAAGQTVPHLHIHLIPRRLGDVADPRGGVRWVIPDKARYWPA
jgi:diadenosine tetraphosphate (Ap4A) HIT family hydrolase